MLNDDTIEFHSRCHRGKVRRNNEDYLGINEALRFAAVADGIGGSAFGEVASQMAVDACLNYLSDTLAETANGGDASSVSAELANAVRYANETIIAVQRNNEQYRKMGTTLSCFVIEAQLLHYAWVGDSRIYKISPQRQSIEQLNEDHTLKRENIDAKLAPNLHRRASSILTQHVGSILLLQPDTGTTELASGDIVLACTDGLTDRVDDETLLEYAIQHASDLDQLAERMLDRALDCGGQDNISLILTQPLLDQ